MQTTSKVDAVTMKELMASSGKRKIASWCLIFWLEVILVAQFNDNEWGS